MVKVDDETLVRGVLAALSIPEGVRLKRIEEVIDSTGVPALRIHFAVSKRIPLTPRRMADLGKLRRTLQEKLFSLEIEKWPYVQFQDAR